MKHKPTTGLQSVVSVVDPRTKIVYGEWTARSFLFNFIAIMCNVFCSATSNFTITPVQPKDTSGASKTLASTSLPSNSGGAVTVKSPCYLQTIIPGTGTAAVTPTDFVINTLIANGAGAGQLVYGAMAFSQPSSNSTRSSFTMSRTFTNSSGSPITIRELALYCKAFSVFVNAVGYTEFDCMIERTLVNFTIPNGESRTVTYTILADVV